VKIRLDGKYRTENGTTVRIICTDRVDNLCPCIGLWQFGNGSEGVVYITEDGRYNLGDLGGKQLIEVSPWSDFQIDEKVMVRDQTTKTWLRGYFAGISDYGLPTTWYGNRTSWSIAALRLSCLRYTWTECRRPTPEELE